MPPPGNALLSDAASQTLAADLAQALQAQEVPAVAGEPGVPIGAWSPPRRSKATRWCRPSPWWTRQGKGRGKAEGAAVPAAAWAAATPATLQQSAAAAAPKIASLLTGIETTREMADPNSLFNRRAKVMVAEVTGAPGDGDDSLTRQMRTHLALLGPDGADDARPAPISPCKARSRGADRRQPAAHRNPVEHQERRGQDLGRVIQLNEIPAGTLDHYWGDVAVVVATEASGGVNDVIKRQLARADTAASNPAAQNAAVRGQAGKPLLEGQRSGVEAGAMTTSPGPAA